GYTVLAGYISVFNSRKVAKKNVENEISYILSISRTTIITAFFLNTVSVYISFIPGDHRQAFS
ncbi:MAG: hypothetical protein ACK55I_49240, partial [bacterium]